MMSRMTHSKLVCTLPRLLSAAVGEGASFSVLSVSAWSTEFVEGSPCANLFQICIVRNKHISDVRELGDILKIVISSQVTPHVILYYIHRRILLTVMASIESYHIYVELYLTLGCPAL